MQNMDSKRETPSLTDLPAPPPGKTGWPWTQAVPTATDAFASGSTLPRVSIVTPSYNQAGFLEETIRSVLLQDYPNLEYIVIDGNSTDRSVEIIRKYERWLAYWVSEPDRGQVDAINKGFQRARGDILAWLNSDDVYLTSDAVGKMVNAFARHPHVDVIYGDAATIDDEGYVRRIRRLPDFDFALLVRTCYVVQPSVFFRSNIIREHPLDASLELAMDYRFWLEVARESPMAHAPHLIAGDRNHAERKTVSRRAAAEEAERTLQKTFGLKFGARYRALRLRDKSFAIWRRLRAIPDLLSLSDPSHRELHRRLRGRSQMLWDQVFGKDYQKL